MAECVPPGAVLIAGARLDELRASPLYGPLPPSARSFVEPWRDASDLLAVFNGTELLFIARGHFREAIPGGTPVGSGLMLSGSQALVQAAMAQRQRGKTGSPDLLAQASTAAAGRAVWIATRGRISLPLTGDAANVNRFLRLADFATLGVHLGSPVQVDFTAQSASAEEAQHLEESLRAFLSLSVLGVRRQPKLRAMLQSADVRRTGPAVQASIAAPADDLQALLDHLSR
jgi:hypothetical protein